mmetsp:Transcript_81820/g.253929  ORF Transcript_81820/g.253929 Transcript_81820/m.253929 type:complete len:210 (+) Transcript_81820:146-775(+)
MDVAHGRRRLLLLQPSVPQAPRLLRGTAAAPHASVPAVRPAPHRAGRRGGPRGEAHAPGGRGRGGPSDVGQVPALGPGAGAEAGRGQDQPVGAFLGPRAADRPQAPELHQSGHGLPRPRLHRPARLLAPAERGHVLLGDGGEHAVIRERRPRLPKRVLRGQDLRALLVADGRHPRQPPGEHRHQRLRLSEACAGRPGEDAHGHPAEQPG